MLQSLVFSRFAATEEGNVMTLRVRFAAMGLAMLVLAGLR